MPTRSCRRPGRRKQLRPPRAQVGLAEPHSLERSWSRLPSTEEHDECGEEIQVPPARGVPKGSPSSCRPTRAGGSLPVRRNLPRKPSLPASRSTSSERSYHVREGSEARPRLARFAENSEPSCRSRFQTRSLVSNRQSALFLRRATVRLRYLARDRRPDESRRRCRCTAPRSVRPRAYRHRATWLRETCGCPESRSSRKSCSPTGTSDCRRDCGTLRRRRTPGS